MNSEVNVKKCRSCGASSDADTDSYETIRVVGVCEDCMNQNDWDRYAAKVALENGDSGRAVHGR